MKTLMLTLGICLLCISYSNAQDSHITQNISKARLNNGAEYFDDGRVKVVVNINMVDFYYEWSKTADTTNLYSNMKGWDSSSLKDFMEAYYSKAEGLNFDEELAKCRLIANEIKKKSLEIANNQKEVASVAE